MTRISAIFLLAVVLIPSIPAPSQAQTHYDLPEDQWEIGFYSGFFSGGTWFRDSVLGEPVTGKTDDGWLTGLRFGTESEYLGWELSVAGVFADLDIEADPASGIDSGGDAGMLMAAWNVLLFPTGNDWADGRVRPFITIGPGLLHMESDFDHMDGETLFDLNAGAGIKFLLSDDGNIDLRFDWRWHYLDGSHAGFLSKIYRQEITAGLGFRF